VEARNKVVGAVKAESERLKDDQSEMESFPRIPERGK
jgi:hypothetical protein